MGSSASRLAVAVAVVLASALPAEAQRRLWRGLTVAPENACTDFHPHAYFVPLTQVDVVHERLRGFYMPWRGVYAISRSVVELAPIVGLEEAHDSGLCAEPYPRQQEFASYPDNLVFEPVREQWEMHLPWISRDAAEWLPLYNRCWYAAKVVEVRRKYRLTIDRAEADVLDRLLAGCPRTELEYPLRGP